MGFKKFLQESINDKNLLKAVILAGGPGSGKSFVAEKMFKGQVSFVNSDLPFEQFLKKADLSFIIDADDEDTYEKQMVQREKAKRLTTNKMYHLINGLLPLIIDGTGKNVDKITSQKEELEKLGYDVSMVFVNTNLDVAQERNQERERVVDPKIVEKLWNGVQRNIGKFQSMFKNNFIVVDNNERLSGKSLTDFNVKLAKESMKMINSPLQNHVGTALIKRLKLHKKKYMSDLLDVEKTLKI